jgi:hypothetical protein
MVQKNLSQGSFLWQLLGKVFFIKICSMSCFSMTENTLTSKISAFLIVVKWVFDSFF